MPLTPIGHASTAPACGGFDVEILTFDERPRGLAMNLPAGLEDVNHNPVVEHRGVDELEMGRIDEPF